MEYIENHVTSSIPILSFSDLGFQPPIFPKSFITSNPQNQLKFVCFTHLIARIAVFHRSFSPICLNQLCSRNSKVCSIFTKMKWVDEGSSKKTKNDAGVSKKTKNDVCLSIKWPVTWALTCQNQLIKRGAKVRGQKNPFF